MYFIFSLLIRRHIVASSIVHTRTIIIIIPPLRWSIPSVHFKVPLSLFRFFLRSLWINFFLFLTLSLSFRSALRFVRCHSCSFFSIVSSLRPMMVVVMMMRMLLCLVFMQLLRVLLIPFLFLRLLLFINFSLLICINSVNQVT